MNKTAVDNRIFTLNVQALKMNLNLKQDYKTLPESEKIPFRVLNAEIIAMEFPNKEFMKQRLDACVRNEYFCGAQGIKNAMDWCEQNNAFL